LLLSPSLVHFKHPAPSVSCSFSVPCLLFIFFLRDWRSVCPAGYAGFSLGWLWKYLVQLICSLVGLLDVCQASLEVASHNLEALLFPQFNVAWRNFVQARSSVCWIPHCSWWFLSAKCGSSVSAKFLIYGAHTVCFCTLVTILDPLRISFN
jgi:hypothetical protein